MKAKISNIEFFTNALIISWDDIEGGWWGEVTLQIKDGKILIDAETMGKDFVKDLLNQMVDGAAMVG
jgi:hypothetical protein